VRRGKGSVFQAVSAGAKTPSKEFLDKIYGTHNRRALVHPDPLEFLYAYSEPSDIEAAGLICSSLAYGKVTQILKSCSRILEKTGPSPAMFITGTPARDFKRIFSGFRHRFTGEDDIAALLSGMKKAFEDCGSLERRMSACLEENKNDMPSAMDSFSKLIIPGGSGSRYLLPSPKDGSACKRFCLWLRWMVRRDEVDPGPWTLVSPRSLVVPMDTHMFKIARAFGFTRRASADFKTALETTAAFAKTAPEDPVKYDFALTRFGIRDDMSMNDLTGGQL
jgi:uncharacterized protein (TIGR02757 family)